MNAPIPSIEFLKHSDAEATLAEVAAGLRAGTITPIWDRGSPNSRNPLSR
jgi:hypothetical protein